MIVLGKPKPKFLLYIKIWLFQFLENKLSNKQLERQRNFEIMAIFNKYKDIFNNFINYLDSEFLNQVGLINKKFCNIFKSKSNLTSLLYGN